MSVTLLKAVRNPCIQFKLLTRIKDRHFLFLHGPSLLLTVLLPPSAPWQTSLQCRAQSAAEELLPPPAVCSNILWCHASVSPTHAGMKGGGNKNQICLGGDEFENREKGFSQLLIMSQEQTVRNIIYEPLIVSLSFKIDWGIYSMCKLN